MSEEMGIVERIARGLKAACIYKDMMGCRKLSRLSGVEFHTTRRYLLGEQTRLRIDEIERLCKVLDTNADDIWSGNGKHGLYRGELDSTIAESSCWFCKRAAAPADEACSWAGIDREGKPSFKPVGGWNAIETDSTEHGASYIVVDCPLFEREEARNVHE